MAFWQRPPPNGQAYPQMHGYNLRSGTGRNSAFSAQMDWSGFPTGSGFGFQDRGLAAQINRNVGPSQFTGPLRRGQTGNQPFTARTSHTGTYIQGQRIGSMGQNQETKFSYHTPGPSGRMGQFHMETTNRSGPFAGQTRYAARITPVRNIRTGDYSAAFVTPRGSTGYPQDHPVVTQQAPVFGRAFGQFAQRNKAVWGGKKQTRKSKKSQRKTRRNH